MIQILKKRLESAMASELELQQREQLSRARTAQLERQLLDSTAATNDQDPLKAQLNMQVTSQQVFWLLFKIVFSNEMCYHLMKIYSVSSEFIIIGLRCLRVMRYCSRIACMR